MTSAPSLLQQLSGNKLKILIILFIGSFLVSCSSSKEVVRPKRDTTSTKKKKRRSSTTKVDTVKWTEVSRDKYPPIVDDGKPKVNKESFYNAALLVPFNARNYNNGDASDENERFIQFYAGVKLGLEKLKSEKINLTLDVLDTEESESKLRAKLRGLNDKTHIIIGPYDRDLIKEAASFAKRNRIPLVSPWQSSSKIANDNPYYIQLRPDLKDHYDKMVEEVLRKYRPEQIVVLKNENGDDDSRVKYIQDYASSILKSRIAPFKEFSVNEDSLILGEYYMTDLFDELNETVFLIQNYSFDDDDFVYNSLRKLSAAKGLRKATVYGLPLLLDTDRIDFNLYKILNVKVVRSRFVDVQQPDISQFKSTFLREYSALPTEEAYYGYDVIVYFGRALQKFGTEFQFYLDQNEEDLLETSFDIQKTFSTDGRVSDDFRDINYFVNKHLDIIEFDQNRFKVAGKN
jgi:hypothetical protein